MENEHELHLAFSSSQLSRLGGQAESRGATDSHRTSSPRDATAQRSLQMLSMTSMQGLVGVENHMGEGSTTARAGFEGEGGGLEGHNRGRKNREDLVMLRAKSLPPLYPSYNNGDQWTGSDGEEDAAADGGDEATKTDFRKSHWSRRRLRDDDDTHRTRSTPSSLDKLQGKKAAAARSISLEDSGIGLSRRKRSLVKRRLRTKSEDALFRHEFNHQDDQSLLPRAASICTSVQWSPRKQSGLARWSPRKRYNLSPRKFARAFSASSSHMQTLSLGPPALNTFTTSSSASLSQAAKGGGRIMGGGCARSSPRSRNVRTGVYEQLLAMSEGETETEGEMEAEIERGKDMVSKGSIGREVAEEGKV